MCVCTDCWSGKSTKQHRLTLHCGKPHSSIKACDLHDPNTAGYFGIEKVFAQPKVQLHIFYTIKRLICAYRITTTQFVRLPTRTHER